MNIRDRKKNRKATQARIAEKLATAGAKKSNYTNENSWYPELDADKNGLAVIRFLPNHDNMSLPWAEVFSHAFKGKNGKWFINQCRTTIGENCPTCEANNEQWDSLEPDEQSARKRVHKYYANVLVVKDPKNPENEGQVKEFRFGAQVFGLLQEAGKEDPLDPDKEVIDAFCPWDGANFQLRIGKDDRGWTSYSKSKFLKPEPIGDDDEIEKVLNQMHDLHDIYLAEKNFKSYDEEQKQLDLVLGNSTRVQASNTTAPAPSVGKTENVAQTANTAVSSADELDDIDALFDD